MWIPNTNSENRSAVWECLCVCVCARPLINHSASSFFFWLLLYRATIDWMSQFKILYAYEMGCRQQNRQLDARVSVLRACVCLVCECMHKAHRSRFLLELFADCGHIKNVMNTTPTMTTPANTNNKLHIRASLNLVHHVTVYKNGSSSVTPNLVNFVLCTQFAHCQFIEFE